MPSSSDATALNIRTGRAWAFWAGCAAVTLGVLLHVPMLLMGFGMDGMGMGMRMDGGLRLADMPMDDGMVWGMAIILGGIGLAGYGLVPRRMAPAMDAVQVSMPEGTRFTAAHWRLMAVLVVALVIDVMKPASLGFVVPGMIEEYSVSRAVVAWTPFAALAGTVVGSLVWGALADVFGRRATILLSSVMFVGTSICGAMPSLWWNVGMCFVMGAAAGGLLPVAYALLAETMPARHRGWSLVLVGGLGGVGGYLAASGASALLQPLYGWRVMWLLNLPTGLVLVALSGMIPESARFLAATGRAAAAEQVMRRFGAVPGTPPPPAAGAAPPLFGATAALSLAALAWGLINFGLLLWLPAELVARGFSMAVTSGLLAGSALIALPTVFAAAALYSRWSTRRALATTLAVSAAGLVGIMLLQAGVVASPVLPVALLIVGSNALLAMLLPYAAETYPLAVRGRATGWVAGCSKLGGLAAQLLGIAAIVPSLGLAAAGMLAATLGALWLVLRFGRDTNGLMLDTLAP